MKTELKLGVKVYLKNLKFKRGDKISLIDK